MNSDSQLVVSLFDHNGDAFASDILHPEGIGSWTGNTEYEVDWELPSNVIVDYSDIDSIGFFFIPAAENSGDDSWDVNEITIEAYRFDSAWERTCLYKSTGSTRFGDPTDSGVRFETVSKGGCLDQQAN